MKTRIPIPRSLQDELLIECGYKCSVPKCGITDSLEFHHIDGDPLNNSKRNLIVLCAVHHHQADLKRISSNACARMKELLITLDGLSLNIGEKLSLSTEEFGSLLDIARDISKESLRVIVEQFNSYLLGRNNGYRCREGINDHDFLVSRGLIYKVRARMVPSLWRISEKGILFCRFLFNSQYFLPFAAFDKSYPKSEIIKWNFEKLPWK